MCDASAANTAEHRDKKAKIEQIQVKGNNDALMERVMKYINAHLADPDLNVEKLTEEVGISRAPAAP